MSVDIYYNIFYLIIGISAWHILTRNHSICSSTSFEEEEEEKYRKNTFFLLHWLILLLNFLKIYTSNFEIFHAACHYTNTTKAVIFNEIWMEWIFLLLHYTTQYTCIFFFGEGIYYYYYYSVLKIVCKQHADNAYEGCSVNAKRKWNIAVVRMKNRESIKYKVQRERRVYFNESNEFPLRQFDVFLLWLPSLNVMSLPLCVFTEELLNVSDVGWIE